MNWLKMMAKFALFCTFSLLTFVQALLSTPKTPTVLTLKRTSSTLLAEKQWGGNATSVSIICTNGH